MLPVVLLVSVFYTASVLTFVDLSSGATVLSRYSGGGGGGGGGRGGVGGSRRDALPPLVPPKLIDDDDDDFEERDVASSAAAADHGGHQLHLASSYWAPTLDNLSPGEAEFYRRRALATEITGRGSSVRSMGRSPDGVRRRSMTMLRMGRGNSAGEEEEEAKKRSMGMLRMGRAASKSVDRGALNMLRMGKREVEENHFSTAVENADSN